MVYSHRRNMHTQSARYPNDDRAANTRIVNVSGGWKAQERTILQDARTDRQRDGGGWTDMSRLTTKLAAAHLAKFSGKEVL